MRELISQLLEFQSPGGTYTSQVKLPSATGEDLNCFVTALVVRELTQILRRNDLPDRELLADSHRRALGYLLRSRYPAYEYTYAFYPPFAHPFWIGGVLPADADDTCIIGLELVRAGKNPPESLEVIADRYLAKYRATGEFNRYLIHSWHVEGAFLTWFSNKDEENPLDLCVNANALALLAAGGLEGTPGFDEAVQLIENGLDWAGGNSGRLRQLTPFYPDVSELRVALAHAVKSGVTSLTDSLVHLDGVLTKLHHPTRSGGSQEFFSSSDGNIVWIAPVIELARELRIKAIQTEDQL